MNDSSWIQQTLIASFEPRKRLSIPEWMETRGIFLPSNVSEPGKMRIDRTPYMRDILEMKMEKTVDISSIDPSLLEDCTINGMVDWDMAKKKLTALTYAFDLDAKKGKYVEKSTIQRWALGMSKIIESALSSIPNRYSAILNAELVEILEREAGRRVELTEEDKSRIRAHMETVAPDIFRSIQEMLGEFKDE